MRVTLDDKTFALLVIEWKYLESYGGKSVTRSLSGTDRVAIYRALIEAADSPIASGEPRRLFYEPYYQLARQTLLAARAVADPDTPESEWLHVDVIPEPNVALRHRVKSAAPLLSGNTLEETWRSALKAPERYRVLGQSAVVPVDAPGKWRGWRRFLRARYLT